MLRFNLCAWHVGVSIGIQFCFPQFIAGKKDNKKTFGSRKRSNSHVLDFYSYLPLHSKFSNIVILNSVCKPMEMFPFLSLLFIGMCAYVYGKNNVITKNMNKFPKLSAFF